MQFGLAFGRAFGEMAENVFKSGFVKDVALGGTELEEGFGGVSQLDGALGRFVEKVFKRGLG